MEFHTIIHNKIVSQKSRIEGWFEDQYKNIQPLFFTSIDIRDSGSKIAPVDTNVFPGGFNNIDTNNIPMIQNLAREFLHKYKLGNKVLIIPESHSRNQFYLENLKILKHILSTDGKIVEIAKVEDLLRRGNRVLTQENFDPETIILNNDFSDGPPAILVDLEQKLLPSLKYGWYSRTKSNHFQIYQETLAKFCAEFKLDPFLFSAKFYNCGNIDFKNSIGLDCIANHVTLLIEQLTIQYKEHGIKDKPYVFVKADSGTYGMGIMAVQSAEEVNAMNKMMRKKMHMLKGGLINTQVLIQEGIRTNITHEGKTAETLVYLLGGQPIQTLLRANSTRDSLDNLNRSGAEFFQIKAIEGILAYHIVARLASLAAALECN